MEVINDSRLPEQPHRKGETNIAGNIYLGIILVAIGVIWLFYNTGWIGYGLFNALFSWQMLLVAAGGYLLAVRRWSAGVIIGGLGVFFVVMDALDISLSFNKIVLPILVMAAGIALIVSRLDGTSVHTAAEQRVVSALLGPALGKPVKIDVLAIDRERHGIDDGTVIEKAQLLRGNARRIENPVVHPAVRRYGNGAPYGNAEVGDVEYARNGRRTVAFFAAGRVSAQSAVQSPHRTAGTDEDDGLGVLHIVGIAQEEGLAVAFAYLTHLAGKTTDPMRRFRDYPLHTPWVPSSQPTSSPWPPT